MCFWCLLGLPKTPSWTELAQTAAAGSRTLVLAEAVNWLPGDEIVVATTGDALSQAQSEKHVIDAVSGNGRTLTLVEPLEYEHISMEWVSSPCRTRGGPLGFSLALNLWDFLFILCTSGLKKGTKYSIKGRKQHTNGQHMT